MTEILGFFVVVGFLAAASMGLEEGGSAEIATLGTEDVEEVVEAAEVEKPKEVNMGKFTTAEEVRMILEVTQGNWVAVREFDGKDLLYFTHLESWRCGLDEIRYRVNGGEEKIWTTDPCYIDEPAPNALKMENGHLTYTTFGLKEVETVEITLVYDDGGVETAEFQRKNIMTP